MKELLKVLAEAYGPPGHEDRVREIIRREASGFADEITTDAMGNLIAVKRGPGPKVMLAAHLDEVAVIVTHLDEHGFLRIAPVGGGLVPHQLIGERLVFANGAVGILGREKVDDVKDIKFNRLFVDIGAKDRAEAEAMVRIGDMATYHRPCQDLGERIVGKALDDRLGCAILLALLKSLRESPNTVYFVFTVQEEVGRRGAGPAAYRLDPDLAIAVDVTLVGDTPKAERMAVSLGKGPAIKIMDASVVVHQRVKELLLWAAEAAAIPAQREILTTGASDAGSIHLSREGVPTGAVSVPCRYVHTPSEMVDMGDALGALALLRQVLTTPLAGRF